MAEVSYEVRPTQKKKTLTFHSTRESCDTIESGTLTNGDYANEEIETSCHQLVCNPKNPLSSSFFRNHPTNAVAMCSSRDGQIVSTRRNVPARHRTNLCKQKPVVPSACSSAHGMLMGLGGSPAQSLYSGYVLRHRDEVVAKTGAGLFVNGGNPIYYTAKGNAEDVASGVQV